jgi:hypothetical protein
MKVPCFIVISGLLFGACVNNVNLDFKDYQTHLVVNSLLVPDSVMKVQLSESRRADQEEIFNPVNDAEVEISYGQSTKKLHNSGNGIYINQEKPLAGLDYYLKIVTKSGEVVTSSSRIPLHPVIQKTTVPEDNLVNFKISDNKNERNFYWIGLKVTSENNDETYYETYVTSDFLLFDDFNRTRGLDSNGEIHYSYHFFARLEDVAFNGKEVSFDLPGKWPAADQLPHINYILYCYIINADEHLDRYLKSALIQYDLRVIGDMPVFYTPVNMYSNITNVKGIFGSYTITQSDITLP